MLRESGNKQSTAKMFKELRGSQFCYTYEKYFLHSFLIPFSYPVLQKYLHLKGC